MTKTIFLFLIQNHYSEKIIYTEILSKISQYDTSLKKIKYYCKLLPNDELIFCNIRKKILETNQDFTLDEKKLFEINPFVKDSCLTLQIFREKLQNFLNETNQTVKMIDIESNFLENITAKITPHFLFEIKITFESMLDKKSFYDKYSILLQKTKKDEQLTANAINTIRTKMRSTEIET